MEPGVCLQSDNHVAEGRDSAVEWGVCNLPAVALLPLACPVSSMGPDVGVESDNTVAYQLRCLATNDLL
jgi:hypothetical protein